MNIPILYSMSDLLNADGNTIEMIDDEIGEWLIFDIDIINILFIITMYHPIQVPIQDDYHHHLNFRPHIDDAI